MELKAYSSVYINNREITRNGTPLTSLKLSGSFSPDEVYQQIQCSYPKFFKMDILSKWAWLGAELLLHHNGAFLYDGLDRNEIAIVLATAHGCIEADKKYNDTISSIASPALFVYTLPNIMLGEISIRHGFKGEQTCLVSDQFDKAEMDFWVTDLIQKRGMAACLAGWIDVTNDNREVNFFWVTKA